MFAAPILKPLSHMTSAKRNFEPRCKSRSASHQKRLTSRITTPPPATMVTFGSKKVFLPNFTLALVRTQHLPPNFAQFIVPLNLNKLDLKDYLYHVYGVEVLSVRSYIEQQKIRHAKPHQGQRHVEWYRPRAIKRMTVELAKPFIYPDEPSDLTAWNKDMNETLKAEREKYQDQFGPDAAKRPSPIRAQLRELAEKRLAEQIVEVEKELKV